MGLVKDPPRCGLQNRLEQEQELGRSAWNQRASLCAVAGFVPRDVTAVVTVLTGVDVINP